MTFLTFLIVFKIVEEAFLWAEKKKNADRLFASKSVF